jgi:hypothetical protein
VRVICVVANLCSVLTRLIAILIVFTSLEIGIILLLLPFRPLVLTLICALPALSLRVASVSLT